ncbi:TonB-dependent receptor [Sphingomonas sp. MG17]|uniref:TonB-dependent receptor n=1 Tax=Sphingomonas tagetis TaxID=2949092 RepID=A0A9X2HS20_9SPHN|nr:TonB-dependent receptor [Sphingomonas tagetis]MCP3732544.1 TonB-dependent receptor [Sphingomonas tagetis]
MRNDILDPTVNRRRKFSLRSLATASVLALTTVTVAPALAQDEPQPDDQTIVVTGVNAPVTTSTGLPLTFMETPQSVTIIDQQRIQDYALTNIKDLLDQVVGVSVERVETDRATFSARGFDVTNFQIDGIGLPLIENTFYGDTDSFLYERIDIIRGANGLTTGVGNPSATVNYIRKRPIFDATHVNVGAYAGSWNKWRLEGDVSVPIGENWAVRALLAHEETDSYLDKYHVNREVYGLVVAGKLTPDLTLTAGYHRQRNDATAATWASLVLLYSDGSFIPYDRSANPAPPWSYWDITEQQAYGELAYAIGSWTVKGIVTYRHYADEFQIDYQYGLPDRVTGLGYAGDSSQFSSTNRRWLGDLYATGKVNLFGRDHQLTFGASYGHSRQETYQGRAISPIQPGIPGYVHYPNFNVPDPFDVPEPVYAAPGIQHDQTDKLTRLYAASQINIADFLKVIAGASWAKYQSNGIYYGEVRDTDVSKLNPYVGVLADVTSFLTAYASYTTIFSPQTQSDINRRQLAPVQGINMEGGIKLNLFDKRFYASAAIFRTEQNGLANFAGVQTGTGGDVFFYYEPEDTISEGFEFEVAGKITPNWSLSGGYTKFKITNTLGTNTQLHIPRQTFKASTTYNMPQLNNASIGAQLRWQSDLAVPADAYGFAVAPVVRQDSYAVLDLMAGIDLVDKVRATVNVRNVTNQLFYNSLAYASYALALYGPGRSFTASLSYRF